MMSIIILVVTLISFWATDSYTEVVINKKAADEITSNSRGPPA